MSDFYSRSIGTPPHTFRLTDEGVDLDGFEPGWYWVLLHGDREQVVEVTVFEETHGIWMENERADTVDFCPMDKLDPEIWSGWAGPLPSPGWDSLFPLLNCGDVDRFPPTERAAATGCTGAGDDDADEPGEWLWMEHYGCWALWYDGEVLATGIELEGCTSLDAVQAKEVR